MINRNTPVEALATLVSQTLIEAGIEAVLSGGAAVQIYPRGLYVSRDLGFVTAAGHRELTRALRRIGFEQTKSRRLYAHTDSDYLVEFPAWPLAVGSQIIRQWARLETDYGPIEILTPTQCVQDRLAAYFHWKDQQALAQAVAVCRRHDVDMTVVRDWAANEDAGDSFERFLRAIADHQP